MQELAEKIQGTKLNMSKNSFCIYPWMHIQLKPNGQAKPCCRFDHMNEAYRDENGKPTMSKYNIHNMTFEEISNSEFWTQLRRDMRNHKNIPGCHKCKKEDDLGGFSMRHNANMAWNNANQQYPENAEIKFKYLELTTGRFCNLACRMCSSDLSTTWDNDDKLLQGLYYDRQDYSNRPQTLSLDFEEEDFKEVTFIKLTGGEPMLSPTFEPFLDTVINSGYAKNILLQIYTNCSWIPKQRIVDKLKQLGIVQINISIDGLESVNDYVRYPSKWNIVEASAKKWVEFSTVHTNFDIILSPTISLYNILQVPKIWNWWKEIQTKAFGKKFIVDKTYYQQYIDKQRTAGGTSYIYQIARFSPTMLQTPHYLHPAMLPDKQETLDALHEIIKQEETVVETKEEMDFYRRFATIIMHIIKALEKDSNNKLQEFVSYSADLDKLREQSLQNDLPNLWNQIKDHVEYKGRL